MYKSLYLYPWDLADEGPAAVLDRVRPLGINTLTVAASYHAGKFLRPHGRAGKVYFPRDGTVYFAARAERYGAIKPLLNPLVAEFDALAELTQHASDLARVAWIVAAHNSALGALHPEFCSQNAFGDKYVYSLCPAHPAVRDYIVNLCADIADRYDLAGIALETPGWLPYEHGFHHEFAMLPLDRWAKTLLALCFADSTRHAAQAAGIDADRLQGQVRGWLEQYFAAELRVPEAVAAEWWLADLVSDPDWVRFLHWRCRLVADLVAEIRAALPKRVRLAVIPTVQRPTAACWLEGSDLATLAAAADVLEVPAYQASAREVAVDAWDVRRRIGNAAPLHFILRPSFPDLAHGTETLEAASRLQQVGMTGLAFYNYGHMRLAGLDQVKRALAAIETP